MDSLPQHRAARSGLQVAGLAFAFIMFALLTHSVNGSAREGILFVWLLASIPMSFAFSILGRIWSVASIFTVATSLWLAAAYFTGDGEYRHEFLAVGIGFAGIASFILVALVFSVRWFRDSDRKRLRKFMNPK
jgi:hypothetical protein